jgi:integrase/recombinase XerD
VTPLRQRMLHELQRRNYSPSTIRSYLGAVQQFAEHFHCSPERLGPEHLRRYQVFLLQEKKLEPSTVEIRISALRFLYKRTLRRRDFTYDDLIFPKVPQKLPIVLSQEEVVRLTSSRSWGNASRALLLTMFTKVRRRSRLSKLIPEAVDR